MPDTIVKKCLRIRKRDEETAESLDIKNEDDVDRIMRVSKASVNEE